MAKAPQGTRARTFWLSEDLCEALRVRAFRERVPQAELVRQALTAYLATELKKPKGTRKRSALSS
jgi:hypothetical protein